MWAVGRYDLGLTEKEWGRLLPWELGELLKRKRAAEDAQDMRAAAVICWLLAPWMREGRSPLEPQDIFPHLARTVRRMNVESAFDLAKAMKKDEEKK